MAGQEIPPWLREQLERFEKLQQNLQAVLIQKQQVEAELREIEQALEELKKVGLDGVVYKSAGSILVKVGRDELMKELEDKRELSNTRLMVLGKQEGKLRESIKELQDRISEAVKERAKA